MLVYTIIVGLCISNGLVNEKNFLSSKWDIFWDFKVCLVTMNNKNKNFLRQVTHWGDVV